MISVSKAKRGTAQNDQVSKKAFTFLELIASINKVRENRAAGQFVSAVTELESALKVWLVDSNKTWPTVNGTVEIDEMIVDYESGVDEDQKVLSKYVPAGMRMYHGTSWHYYNDGEVDIEQDINCTKGVGIKISAAKFDRGVINKIEQSIDGKKHDQATSCGKFYYEENPATGTNSLYYIFAPSKNSVNF